MPTWTVTRCRGKDCNAPIVFLKNEATGRAIPVNYDGTVDALDTYYVQGRHTRHHTTCPNVEDFRKKKARR